jgi:hypothetical protein
MRLDPSTTKDFLTIWQGSESLAAVAARCGQSKATVSARAARLRRKYPGLKTFRRQGPELELPTPDAAAKLVLFSEKGLAGAEAELGITADDGADWDE